MASTATERRGTRHPTPPEPRLYRRLFALAPDGRPYLFLAVAAGVLATALTMAQAGLLSHIVSTVFWNRTGVAVMGTALAALLLVAAFRGGALLAAEMLGQVAACRVKRAVRDRLARALLELGPAGLRSERTGDLSTLLGEGVEGLDEYLRSYLVLVTLAFAGPLLVLALYLAVDPLSALALCVIAPFVPVLMILIGLRTRALMDRRWAELGRMSAHFLDMLQGLPTLKVFGHSRLQAKQIEQVSRRYGTSTMDVLKVAFQSSLVLDLSATMGVALVAIEVGTRLLLRSLPFERALFVLLLAPEFFLPLRQFAAARHARMSAGSAAARIFRLIGEPPASGRGTDTELAGDIVLEDVQYTPPGRTEPVLRRLNLCLPEGQMTALTGPSGSGKSTIANLLLCFLQPGGGRLLVGGTDLRRVAPEAWRRRIAFVPQQPHFFHGTVSENIRLGNTEASAEEVAAAAREACADDFVTTLPQGYETEIGEGGTRLSGGQRQRLALARAFLEDRPIMVLDEPTVHLDGPLEARVWASIRRHARDRTVLLITHDPELARGASRSVHLVEGTAAEESLV